MDNLEFATKARELIIKSSEQFIKPLTESYIRVGISDKLSSIVFDNENSYELIIPGLLDLKTKYFEDHKDIIRKQSKEIIKWPEYSINKYIIYQDSNYECFIDVVFYDSSLVEDKTSVNISQIFNPISKKIEFYPLCFAFNRLSAIDFIKLKDDLT